MNSEYIPSLNTLLKVKTEENYELMVRLDLFEPAICCNHQNLEMIPYVGGATWVRETVQKKILEAQEIISNENDQLKLFVQYGYRHPEIQQNRFNSIYEHYQRLHPGLEEEELLARAHLLIAHPAVAGHPTGGAVDVTIMENGKEWDMGCEIADFTDEEKIKTFSNAITHEQKERRLFLLKILTEVGFAPFYGEWWHFSYGDREWASFYGMPHAHYDSILIE